MLVSILAIRSIFFYFMAAFLLNGIDYTINICVLNTRLLTPSVYPGGR